ncbi:DUF418 domain-containing protein [Salipaludibacillus sp. HK11]|uniref:DUF418 domain-containing protein n=1 Tax=Salipaludibacillus sp. HK11 TaxID=3394320 RepID=UPI0039FC482F
MKNRIPVLDIARGAAIIGTLGTNIWIFATLGSIDFLIDDDNYWYGNWETVVEAIFLFFMNGKFLGLLTILFGMGLEIKRRSYIRHNQKKLWPWLYVWGMMLLLVDGFLHYLFVFEFDVLMSYAITGMIVAFILKFKNKIIKRIAIVLGIIHVIGVMLLGILIEVIFRIDSAREEFLREIQQMSSIYLSNSYWDQVVYRFTDFWGLRGEAIGIIPMNILLFLLGVYLIRTSIFENSEDGRRRRKKLLIIGLGIGIPLNALVFLPTYSMAVIVRYLFAPLMALGYFMLFHLLLEKKVFSFLFRRLTEVGRTALSCYMLQNMIASILFYGWGFALGGQLNAIGIIVVWLLISCTLILFAHVWLKKFSTGPFEIIWRKLINLPMFLINNKKNAA